MGKGSSIVKSVFSGGGNILGSLFGDGISDGPKGMPSGGPKGPEPDLNKSQLAAKRTGVTGSGEAPMFLGLSSQMTPLQQRSAIATQATSGGDKSFNDPETLKYYRQLALSSLMDDKGGVAPNTDITDIEKQFMRQLGQEPRNDSTESFLSALERAIGM
jgi:hypothetical protein